MFVILGKKEYNKLRDEIDALRYDVEHWKKQYEEEANKRFAAEKRENVQKLAIATATTNMKEEMKKLDMEWYVKWCDEVQKRAAVTQLLRNEMDRRLGLDEEDDDEEGESV